VHLVALQFTSGRVDMATLETTQPADFAAGCVLVHRLALRCISEDDGTRTRNHRIDSPPLPGIGSPKSFPARMGAQSHFVSLLVEFDPDAGINCCRGRGRLERDLGEAPGVFPG